MHFKSIHTNVPILAGEGGGGIVHYEISFYIDRLPNPLIFSSFSCSTELIWCIIFICFWISS